MGHCIESGFALVEGDRPLLLDDEATEGVVAAISRSEKEAGIRLRAQRTMREGTMHTVEVLET